MGRWNISKGRLKQVFARVTNNTLRCIEGQEDELTGRMQKQAGDDQQALERFIDECLISGVVEWGKREVMLRRFRE